mmetsp:Transcript_73778/g.213695  ORF Transcript_73778/g.213695 Transcript_73778/m.213695 type:complete len:329 (-) Transcript_73778:254-1240(-)
MTIWPTPSATPNAFGSMKYESSHFPSGLPNCDAPVSNTKGSGNGSGVSAGTPSSSALCTGSTRASSSSTSSSERADKPLWSEASVLVEIARGGVGSGGNAGGIGNEDNVTPRTSCPGTMSSFGSSTATAVDASASAVKRILLAMLAWPPKSAVTRSFETAERSRSLSGPSSQQTCPLARWIASFHLRLWSLDGNRAAPYHSGNVAGEVVNRRARSGLQVPTAGREPSTRTLSPGAVELHVTCHVTAARRELPDASSRQSTDSMEPPKLPTPLISPWHFSSRPALDMQRLEPSSHLMAPQGSRMMNLNSDPSPPEKASMGSRTRPVHNG